MCADSSASSLSTWMTRRPSTYCPTMARSTASASKFSAWMVASVSSPWADSGVTASEPLPLSRTVTSSPFSTSCLRAHSAGSVMASVDGPSRWTFRVSMCHPRRRPALIFPSIPYTRARALESGVLFRGPLVGSNMGFGSYDESEQGDQDTDIDEDGAVNVHENDHDGEISFDSEADSDELIDQLQSMKDD